MMDEKTFNNRRPHLYQKQPSAFEKRLTASELAPYDNILDIYGVVMTVNQQLTSVDIFVD
jgi:hypothetical protein